MAATAVASAESRHTLDKLTPWLTVVTSNVAAKAPAHVALRGALRSAQDDALSFRTSDRGGIFLLAPWSSDHLGTWHEYYNEANTKHSDMARYLFVVLEEAKTASNEDLMCIESVDWHGSTFYLYDVGYSWGAGKTEIRAHLAKKNDFDSTGRIVVPAMKGLFCALFVNQTTKVSDTKSMVPALKSIKSATKVQRPSGTKYGANVFSLHTTTHNVVQGFWDICHQTHTGAIGFILKNRGSGQDDPRIIYGAHFSFCGETHPDHSGQRMRSQQLNLVRMHARGICDWHAGMNMIRGCIFGDLNIRPISPYGLSQPGQNFHNTARMDVSDLSKSEWETTEAWTSSPYSISRPVPLHPPTYPICTDAFLKIFMSPPEVKARALKSPRGLLRFVEMHFESQGARAPGAVSKGDDDTSRETYILYDTARSNRFTPASWCDGEITFFL